MLACMALAVRAVVPQGYMIAPSASSGAVSIVLCEERSAPPRGAESHLHDDGHAGDAPAGAADQESEHPCIFSGFSAAAALEAPTLVAAADWREVDLVLGFAAKVAPGRGIAAPPPPSTGPPLLI